MRLPLAALLILCAGTSSVLAAPPPTTPRTFPYRAYVIADTVQLRSGPGEDFYPTEQLKSGMELEVYRQEKDGWCGVRPLPESFSWVNGRFLKLGKDGLGEIVGDRVPSRVGSQFGDERDVVQIFLKRGETVEVRDSVQVASGANAVTWYKMSPPSGEFRWIPGRYLRRTRPDQASRRSRGEAVQRTVSRLPDPAVLNLESKDSEVVPAGNEESPDSPSKTTAAKSSIAILPGPADDIAPAEPQPPGVVAQPTESLAGPPVASAAAPTDFQSELDDINAALSVMLAEDPSTWRTAALVQRAQALHDRAQTALERGQARILLNRLAQSDDVQRRYQVVNRFGTDPDVRNRTTIAITRSRPPIERDPRPSDRFDGVGRLKPLTTTKLGAPRYALVDERGNVRCYVTPAPGVNMSYYVNHRVGVSGSRTFMSDQQADLVTAKHITPLDSRVR